MARVKTDERIVVAMTELLRRQGYAATGIKQVVDAAGAPIGSIYHHFSGGKRDVAAAALRRSGAAYGELVGMLLAPYDDIAEGIEAAFVSASETIADSGWLNMCPVGTVAGRSQTPSRSCGRSPRRSSTGGWSRVRRCIEHEGCPMRTLTR